jgi:hypothetical protein
MRLYDEIFKSADGLAFRKYTVVVGGGGYFEGVKSVGDFSTERIILFYPKCSLQIDGKDLMIKKYCDGDLELSGVVHTVTLLNGDATKHSLENTQYVR